ncbi:hypothetical protein AM493_01400 [Flavobacterium akiainvivens]|uniref:AB hydrolase-1 domain-containing protein n=1 Tax=Flavobacterium akiainvivens TaxID=1202724 RepID=A0A0M8MFR9_9FLAO|nr:alpha/beta hydrolase [Flavobacterium akiainvivens]KOS04847.1 hypothetical protein AM493_01400 [Flavobacterium akiainvivens]SFQ43341.1 Pimeloyl-ACP methyl ester carboxylesterase [Flavobacterium akiainvivens]
MKTLEKRETILFITGAFVSHTTWNRWISYFEDKGYNAIAPSWPHKEKSAAELRALQPHDHELAALTLSGVVSHYAQIALRLGEKPVVIGHSLGGLVAQILINQGYAKGGVAIHAVPPKGVIPYEFTFLKSSWKLLGLFSSLKKTYLMSFADFQYAFGNGMSYEEQAEAYELYAIPESKRVGRGGLTDAAFVDYSKRHAPLLLTAGLDDNVIPAHLTRRVFNKYRKGTSVLEYAEFATNHSVLTHDDWEIEASYIANFLEINIPAAQPFAAAGLQKV